MRIMMLGLAAAMLVAGCESDGLYGGGGYGAGGRPGDWRRYDYNRPDPAYGGYDASRYYREQRNARERRLGRQDRIYRGQDGRYYCRRPDGTTGLIVGAIAGGVLGNIIAPGGSETFGTILGAGAGALAGQAVDRSDARCR